MRALALVPAAVLAAASVAPWAQPLARPDSDRARSENAASFFEDGLMDDVAAVCEARFPGYRARHEPALAAWRRAHAQALADGERTVRELLPRLGETLASAHAKARAAIRRLATAPPDVAARECRAVAVRIGAEA